MPPSESHQHKLDRVRRPRVHITYDVHLDGAIETKKLPFVVGVLADLSGKPDQPLPRLRDRKFVEIDAENFDKILAGMAPRLSFPVANELQPGSGTQLGVELNFRHLSDFDPEQVVRQVPALRKLLEAREKLANLANRLDSNEKAADLLQKVIADTEALRRIHAESGRPAEES
ncbi:type VI secretion system contractile sheath small subunit [Tundrisphaera sp. TA3]|uniref:type VI secretion system contractile sheath small subunit n=1 Tax=Tundrisphaera sp. TA3 TaxID=3435775 RepID=UPI003EC007D2